MRLILTAAGAAALFLCSGCSSDADARGQIRAQVIEGCKTGAAGKELPGVNADQLCTCVGDKLIEGRSADELNRLDEAGRNAAAQQAAMQCAMAQMGGEAK